jgi:uncharacterized protein (TIGR00299 family) protein
VALEPLAHLHLDPVGGIAGDMFVAAILHARPELEAGLREELRRSGLPEGSRIRLAPARRGGLAGLRFEVEVDDAPSSGTLAAILERLAASALGEPVKRRAAAIYRRLGEAEAAVHGVPVEAVHFHEIADWDSFVDIVAAAFLIEALGCASWSIGPLPLGSGTVATAHGLLPVPAPATALLLRGFAVVDDGLPGERVTPTGAAILAELAPAPRPPERPLRIVATGQGLGSRELPGKPNSLRVLVLAEAEAADDPACDRDRVAVLRFEVDDQPAEDLALGLERLRARDDVLDLCQWPVVGKAGRLASAVQVLCLPSAVEAVARACLAETTTLGVRIETVERRILARETVTVEAAGRSVRVKRARRPEGVISAKAELADLAREGDAAARSRLRRAAEAAALDRREEGS